MPLTLLFRVATIQALSLSLMLAAVPAGAQTPQPSQDGSRPAAALNVDRLFATSCGWCHQSGGRAQGRGPKLAGTDKTDEFIINRIKHGKPPGMPAFGKSFNDAQIQAIIAYIRSLQEAPQ